MKIKLLTLFILLGAITSLAVRYPSKGNMEISYIHDLDQEDATEFTQTENLPNTTELNLGNQIFSGEKNTQDQRKHFIGSDVKIIHLKENKKLLLNEKFVQDTDVFSLKNNNEISQIVANKFVTPERVDSELHQNEFNSLFYKTVYIDGLSLNITDSGSIMDFILKDTEADNIVVELFDNYIIKMGTAIDEFKNYLDEIGLKYGEAHEFSFVSIPFTFKDPNNQDQIHPTSTSLLVYWDEFKKINLVTVIEWD